MRPNKVSVGGTSCWYHAVDTHNRNARHIAARVVAARHNASGRIGAAAAGRPQSSQSPCAVRVALPQW